MGRGTLAVRHAVTASTQTSSRLPVFAVNGGALSFSSTPLTPRLMSSVSRDKAGVSICIQPRWRNFYSFNFTARCLWPHRLTSSIRETSPPSDFTKAGEAAVLAHIGRTETLTRLRCFPAGRNMTRSHCQEVLCSIADASSAQLRGLPQLSHGPPDCSRRFNPLLRRFPMPRFTAATRMLIGPNFASSFSSPPMRFI